MEKLTDKQHLVESVSDDEAAILEAVSRLLRRGSKKSKRQVRVILEALVSEA